MKIQHFLALVALSLATVPGARAAVREFKARTLGLLNTNSARLRGQVNPRGSGSPTAAWFEWGTATNYGNAIGMQDVGQDSSVSNLNVVLDGLMGGPTYHYRLVATNAFGAVYGADQTINLSFVPIPIPGLPAVGSGSSAAWAIMTTTAGWTSCSRARMFPNCGGIRAARSAT